MTAEREDVFVAERYTYRLAWSAQDAEFIATVVEFPSLSWIARTRAGALRGLTSMVEGILQDMREGGEEIPAPWDETVWSRLGWVESWVVVYDGHRVIGFA